MDDKAKKVLKSTFVRMEKRKIWPMLRFDISIALILWTTVTDQMGWSGRSFFLTSRKKRGRFISQFDLLFFEFFWGQKNNSAVEEKCRSLPKSENELCSENFLSLQMRWNKKIRFDREKRPHLWLKKIFWKPALFTRASKSPFFGQNYFGPKKLNPFVLL